MIGRLSLIHILFTSGVCSSYPGNVRDHPCRPSDQPDPVVPAVPADLVDQVRCLRDLADRLDPDHPLDQEPCLPDQQDLADRLDLGHPLDQWHPDVYKRQGEIFISNVRRNE